MSNNRIFIGDSITVGANYILEPWGEVFAAVGRNVNQGITILRNYPPAYLPGTVCFLLGTNNGMTRKQFDTVMQICKGRQIYFMTIKLPRNWRVWTNRNITAGVTRYPNAHLLDWRKYSKGHPNWFSADGIHPKSGTTFGTFVLRGLHIIT